VFNVLNGDTNLSKKRILEGNSNPYDNLDTNTPSCDTSNSFYDLSSNEFMLLAAMKGVNIPSECI
jgi:hypothetical protein